MAASPEPIALMSQEEEAELGLGDPAASPG